MTRCTTIVFFLLNFSLWISPLGAQIHGTITNEAGEPLPFATVYVEGTTQGTTSNPNGAYSLELEPGSYRLVFQYLGYRPYTAAVEVGTKGVQLDVTLQRDAVDLQEVVVRADAEDPAYPIIRKAMAKRKYYRDQVPAYQCKAYVKGNIKFLDAPEKFMGRDLGDLGGTLDSNRQGIIYLAESTSRLSYRAPDDYREEMISTKVSGNDNGFGFNRASQMDFNLYENYAYFNRQIVSPIAGNAFAYYKYRLIGSLPGESGRTVHKIEVIPRRSEDPVYQGYLYIVDSLWNIQQADLMLRQGAMKVPALDSLRIRQVYVPVEEPDIWRLFSQHIDFKAGLFSFRLAGNFTGIFSEYDLDPEFDKNTFGGEVFRVEDGANELPMLYWDTIRPVPLTPEERLDYMKKDSLQEIRRSKPYLDSLDREQNRFRLIDLFAGYDYENSYRKRELEVGSPLTTIQFNTVQGWNAGLSLHYRQEYGPYSTRWWEAGARFNYGFSDRRLRYALSFTYRFDQVHRTQLRLSGGVEAAQYNAENPISPTVNSMLTLINRRNYLKLYDRSFGALAFQRELINGLRLQTAVEYARRSPLVNQSNYSFRDQDSRAYLSNDPQDPLQFDPAFEAHQALIWTVELRYRFGQKYASYPRRRFILDWKGPEVHLRYRKGLPWAGSDINYDHLSAWLEEKYQPVGVAGFLTYHLGGGGFLQQDRLFFMDFEHFLGNQTIFGNPERYLRTFLLLPYYDYSTAGGYGRATAEHHFDGFLLDKVPGIRKLGWKVVLGAAFLYTKEQQDYLELRAGMENIGWSVFRFLRVDGVFSRNNDGDWDAGFVLGFNLPANN